MSMTDADRFLLLGPNDNEKMRLLLVPYDGRVPEIRTLSLTFAEAKARLEEKWEIQGMLNKKERERETSVNGRTDENDNQGDMMEIGIYCPSTDSTSWTCRRQYTICRRRYTI